MRGVVKQSGTDWENINDRRETAGAGMLPNPDFHAIVLMPGDFARPGPRGRSAMIPPYLRTPSGMRGEDSPEILRIALCIRGNYRMIP
jgi:hypothetical protein